MGGAQIIERIFQPNWFSGQQMSWLDMTGCPDPYRPARQTAGLNHNGRQGRVRRLLVAAKNENTFMQMILSIRCLKAPTPHLRARLLRQGPPNAPASMSKRVKFHATGRTQRKREGIGPNST